MAGQPDRCSLERPRVEEPAVAYPDSAPCRCRRRSGSRVLARSPTLNARRTGRRSVVDVRREAAERYRVVRADRVDDTLGAGDEARPLDVGAWSSTAVAPGVWRWPKRLAPPLISPPVPVPTASSMPLGKPCPASRLPTTVSPAPLPAPSATAPCHVVVVTRAADTGGQPADDPVHRGHPWVERPRGQTDPGRHADTDEDAGSDGRADARGAQPDAEGGDPDQGERAPRVLLDRRPTPCRTSCAPRPT